MNLRRTGCPGRIASLTFAATILLAAAAASGSAAIATQQATAAPALAVPIPAAPTTAAYSRVVTQICDHALLFEGRHAIGTRAGAVEVARDIRSSTRRRLARVAALPVPLAQRGRVGRWLSLERRLAEMYASTYVRVYDVITALSTPTQRARAPRLLWRIAHAPDPLRRAAARLEQQLGIPGCTGG